MSYCGASRCLENRIFSPTQSFNQLTSSNRGRTALPPSQPQAAATDAGPATADRRSNARRSHTRRKPPSIPTGNHRAQRRGVHHKHQNHVHDEERREDPHRPEMPVARRLKSAEQRSEPGELRRLVDRESREDRQHPEQNDERVRELLERSEEHTSELQSPMY